MLLCFTVKAVCFGAGDTYHDAVFFKLSEISVNGCEAERGILILELEIYLLSGRVIAARTKLVENRLTLLAGFERRHNINSVRVYKVIMIITINIILAFF